MRHGPGSPPETVIASDLVMPPPALPRIDDTAAIARALEAVAVAVSRLESRLDQVLAVGKLAQTVTLSVQPSATPGIVAPSDVHPAEQTPTAGSSSSIESGASTMTDKHSLERELCTLLAEISRVRGESVPATADRPVVDDSTHAHLGKLRRRQASILARLLQLDGDPGGDEMCFL